MEAISDPQADESTKIVAAVAAVTSIAVITVAARLCVRTFMVRSFGWDDVLITLTTACSIVGLALTVVQANYGAGRHRGDVPADVYGYGMFVNFVNQPIYLFAICFVKLAVGASLMRIATERLYQHIIMGVMGFMLFYTIACFFTIMFQCTDVRVLWDPSVAATCWTPRTIKALAYTNASLNIVTDLLFSIFIPLPMLWCLHVNFRTWMILMCILGLGVFACAAASVKVSFLTNYGKKGDFLWDSRNITIWTATELNVAITAASLSCLKPLFKRVLGSTYGRGSRERSRNQYCRRQSWQALSHAKQKDARKKIGVHDTESQIAFELGSSHVQAFVHDQSVTTTEIGQTVEERRESKSSEARTSRQDEEKNIFATATTTVHYSLR